MPSKSVEELRESINRKVCDFLAKRQEEISKIMEYKSVKTVLFKNLNASQI